MESELWTRCPKASILNVDIAPFWWCNCHGSDANTLVGVPFDEAKRRAVRALEATHPFGNWEAIVDVVLRAALGEDT